MRDIPFLPLLATLLVQSIVTLAAFSLSTAAPAVGRDLGIAGEQVGAYVSIVYGVGMASALFSASFIHRFGAIRVSQFILVSGIAMAISASLGQSVLAVAFSGVLLGAGYGATAPSSSHILVRRTPAGKRNLVFGIRQIGVPLGGVLAGLIVPPLVLAFGWRTTVMIEIAPMILVILLLQPLRRVYDTDRDPSASLGGATLFGPMRLLREIPAIRRLSISCIFFSGLQLCFIAFMSIHLVQAGGLDLVRAGQALALYQVAGVLSRLVWGVLADKVTTARTILIILGVVMATTALAMGTLGTDWPWPAVLATVIVAGATASGYTGLAYAEYARIGGERTAEATALGSVAMFFGVLVMPSGFSIVLTFAGYPVAYGIAGVLAGIGALLLLFDRSGRREGHA